MEPKERVPESVRKEFARERLLRDLREITNYPLATVYALPKEDNLWEWHANLIGPKGTDYEGGCFHLAIVFPDDYPMQPPKVKLLTTVKRDHVFGEWICLDMLQSWGGFSKEKYTGWTTAYSTLSILLQLQAFIFEAENESWASTDAIKSSCIKASSYRCQGCPHDMSLSLPWPWRDGMQVPFNPQQTEARFAKGFKRQIDIERELNQRKKLIEKTEKSAVMEEVYKKVSQEVAEQMRKEIEKNRKKLQSKFATKEQKELEESSKSNNNNNNKPVKQKKLVLNKLEDKQLNVLWHSNLNPMASTFVPSWQRESANSTSNSNADQKAEISNTSSVTKKISNYYASVFDMLPTEILYELFSYLPDRRDLESLARVCKLWHLVVRKTFIIEKRETICFHSKRTWEEDTLGVGITYSLHPKSHDLQYITTRLDLIGHIAFYKENVRQSVWQEPFTNWIPLYINESHGTRALKYIQNEVYNVYRQDFKPFLAVDLYAKLMNTMVVQVMDGNLHASIVALQGYCYFHRMIIALVHEYPQLQHEIDVKVNDFIVSDYNRHKQRIPSIGEFLPLLTVSKYSWDQLKIPVIKETLVRNVLWIAKKHPTLGAVSQDLDAKYEQKRDTLSFDATTTSLRLIMFHVYFLTSVAKVGKVTAKEMAKEYDMRFGKPSEKMQNSLQKAIFKIQNVKSYDEFFARVKLPPPSKEFLLQLLRECVQESAKKKYHKYSHQAFKPKPKKEDPSKKKKKPTLNLDDL